MKWENTVRLGDLAKVLNGYAFKSKEYTSQGIRIIRITNVQKGCIKDDNPKYVEAGRKDEFSRYMLESGDILISLTGNVGRVGVINKELLPAALNQRVGALKIKNDTIVPAYLYQLLNSDHFERDAVKNSKGIAQLNLSSKWIEEYQIPLPPLSEQKRIAGILDAADSLRAKRREALAQLDTLLQSTFLDLFGDPVTNPKGWEVAQLGDNLKILGGYAFKSSDFSATGLPIIRISNLSEQGITIEGCARIPREKIGKGARFRIEAGDTLIAMSGATTGKLGYVPADLKNEWYLNQRVGAFRVPQEGKITQKFLRALLSSSFYQRHVWNLAGGAAQPNISGKQLESVKSPLPPLPLQQRFAAIVEQVEAQKARMRAQLTELDTLFAALQQRAFNGEL